MTRACRDELAGGAGQRPGPRRHGEDHQPGCERALAAPAVAERPHGQQQPGEHQGVGVDDPLQGARPRRQVPAPGWAAPRSRWCCPPRRRAGSSTAQRASSTGVDAPGPARSRQRAPDDRRPRVRVVLAHDRSAPLRTASHSETRTRPLVDEVLVGVEHEGEASGHPHVVAMLRRCRHPKPSGSRPLVPHQRRQPSGAADFSGGSSRRAAQRSPEAGRRTDSPVACPHAGGAGLHRCRGRHGHKQHIG